MMCLWYVLCDKEAVGVVRHPAFELVPVCQRCADKHELHFETCEHCGERLHFVEQEAGKLPFINGGGLAECPHGLTHADCMQKAGCEIA